MTRVARLLVAAIFLASAALAITAMRRSEPELRLAAQILQSTGSARVAFRPVEIVVSDWSTGETHHMLARTLRERGPVAFLDALCSLWPRGSVRVLGNRDVTIRYAWKVIERGGAARLYLAADSPISLTASWFRLPSDVEPLVFMEVHLNRDGIGVGKLSEARRLTVDESRNVIELRDYTERPAQLVMVERLAPVEH